MAVGSLITNAHPEQSLRFSDNYTGDAVRRTGMTKRRQVQALRTAQLELTPQKVGTYAARIRMTDQENKSPQDRFIDFFA